MQHIADAAAALASGRTSAEALVDAALGRISDPGGEGRHAFTTVHSKAARAEAPPPAAARTMLQRVAGKSGAFRWLSIILGRGYRKLFGGTIPAFTQNFHAFCA